MSESDTHDDPSSHTAFSCAECETAIQPGDARVPAGDGALHVACSNLRNARERYTFFIGNPPEEGAASFSLWYDAGEREYPIIYNTGGTDAFASASKLFGNSGGIEPTTSFFQAIGYTFHWLQSYRPLPHDTERINKEIENEIHRYYPEGKIPDHEEWALYLIISRLYRARAAQPEWQPIVNYCDTLTAFPVPEVIPYTRE